MQTVCRWTLNDKDDVNGGVNELVPNIKDRRPLETFSFIAARPV